MHVQGSANLEPDEIIQKLGARRLSDGGGALFGMFRAYGSYDLRGSRRFKSANLVGQLPAKEPWREERQHAANRCTREHNGFFSVRIRDAPAA